MLNMLIKMISKISKFFGQFCSQVSVNNLIQHSQFSIISTMPNFLEKKVWDQI